MVVSNILGTGPCSLLCSNYALTILFLKILQNAKAKGPILCECDQAVFTRKTFILFSHLYTKRKLKRLPRLRVCDSSNILPLTVNLYFTPIVQRYSKLSKRSSFVPHAPKIRIKLTFLSERTNIRLSCQVMYAKNVWLQVYAKGLRNAERARKLSQKH